jgi:hypothetical protein
VVLGLLAADKGGTGWLGHWLAVDLLYGAGAGWRWAPAPASPRRRC